MKGKTHSANITVLHPIYSRFLKNAYVCEFILKNFISNKKINAQNFKF